MLVQVREGSSARNLDTLLPLLAEGRLGDWCLATDDIHVDDLMDYGHLDALLRRVVAAGVPAAIAARHASLVPARHYGLTDRGAVAPGYLADLFIVEDLAGFQPHAVLKRGKVVLPGNQDEALPSAAGAKHENSVRIGTLDESSFVVRPGGRKCSVIRLVPDNIITRHESAEVPIDPSTGCWVFEGERDLVAIACIERHRASGRVGAGLVRGFGFRRDGAMGSSVAHDAHNLVIAGTNAGDMLACARSLEEMGGGLVVASGGRAVAKLPLAVAGLISALDFQSVRQQLDDVTEAVRNLGCPLPAPFGTLSFMCLSVIPEVRITDRGVFDVLGQKIVPL
jgi:adenine deaminase